jgi:uncharacterized protein (TIGR02118 family)
MVKLIMLIHRRSGMDAQEFCRYWRDDHGPIASRMPGIRKYVQNHAVVSPDGTSPPYDGFAEVWFDDVEALEKSFASPEGQATTADAEKFIDLERMETFVVDEVDMIG